MPPKNPSQGTKQKTSTDPSTPAKKRKTRSTTRSMRERAGEKTDDQSSSAAEDETEIAQKFYLGAPLKLPGVNLDNVDLTQMGQTITSHFDVFSGINNPEIDKPSTSGSFQSKSAISKPTTIIEEATDDDSNQSMKKDPMPQKIDRKLSQKRINEDEDNHSRELLTNEILTLNIDNYLSLDNYPACLKTMSINHLKIISNISLKTTRDKVLYYEKSLDNILSSLTALQSKVVFLQNKINGIQTTLGDPGNVLKNIEKLMKDLMIQKHQIIPSKASTPLGSIKEVPTGSQSVSSIPSGSIPQFTPSSGNPSAFEAASIHSTDVNSLVKRGLEKKDAILMNQVLESSKPNLSQTRMKLLEKIMIKYDLSDFLAKPQMREWFNKLEKFV